MAKKFTRGITDVKDITKQDFDTNNVNDLLSDGEHNYIHRKKKDKTEEYHNLTNNLKTLSSSNTDLLTVTNNNNSNNTATLHPHHDAQKEQVIESTRSTIAINHAENGTANKTNVDTNPQIVLEHENLIAGNNLTKEHVADTNTTTLKVADDFTNKVNKATNDIVSINSTINELKETKQDKLIAGDNITIQGNTISALANTGTSVTTYGARGDNYYVIKITNPHTTTLIIEMIPSEEGYLIEAGSPLNEAVGSLLDAQHPILKSSNVVIDNSNGTLSIKSAPESTSTILIQGTFTFYNE